MKQILEISGLKYDAEQKIATIHGANSEVREGGEKHLLTEQDHSFYSETSPTKEEIVAFGKTLIEPGREEDFDVVVTDMEDAKPADEAKEEGPSEEGPSEEGAAGKGAGDDSTPG